MESWQNVTWQNPIQTNKPGRAPVMGVTQGARRATGVTPITGNPERPDPEVAEMKTRGKLPQIQAHDPPRSRCLYRTRSDWSTSSPGRALLLQPHDWRRQRSEGLLNAMQSKKRGRKTKEQNPLTPKVAELEKENERLKRRLREAHTIIEVQKKVCEMLEISPDGREMSDKDW